MSVGVNRHTLPLRQLSVQFVRVSMVSLLSCESPSSNSSPTCFYRKQQATSQHPTSWFAALLVFARLLVCPETELAYNTLVGVGYPDITLQKTSTSSKRQLTAHTQSNAGE